MFLHDTNILTTFAKIDRLDLPFLVLNRKVMYVSGNVEAELLKGIKEGVKDLQRVVDLIVSPTPQRAFKIIQASSAEKLLYNQITFYPKNADRNSKGEMDTVALAWTRNATVVTNERKVLNFCRSNSYKPIPCLSLEDLLRALWSLGLMIRTDVSALITEIESKDRVLVNRTNVF